MNKYFVGIGIARAGTSWLGEYFKIHPEICFSPVKEIHYFDTIYLKNEHIQQRRINKFKEIAKDLDLKPSDELLFNLRQQLYFIEMFSNPAIYHQYFSWIKKDNEKICGEITPAYSLLPKQGFSEMKRLLNKPKIILLLRNPVDRQWSQVKFHKKFFPDLKFNEYYLESFNNDKFIQRSNYQTLLNILFSIFSRSEIHIIFYETLFNSDYRQSVLKSLCDFLEVDYFQSTIKDKVNSSVAAQLSPELRLYGIKKLKDSYKYTYHNFKALPNNWLSDLKLLNLI